MIPNRLIEILKRCDDTSMAQFPATEVFNEGWMLRLVLDALQTLKNSGFPIQFLPGSRWYSEALLESPFKPAFRGDKLAEGFTHADAVIGHFAFDPASKNGVRLDPGAKQFVVVEAKMFSNLSAGTTNASAYDQATRNVACIAHTISASRIPLDQLGQVAFFVIAPSLERRMHRNTNLETCVDQNWVQNSLARRIAAYDASRSEEAQRLRAWEGSHFLPLVERLASTNSLSVLSWEECLKAISSRDTAVGVELQRFYERCLWFNSQQAQ